LTNQVTIEVNDQEHSDLIDLNEVAEKVPVERTHGINSYFKSVIQEILNNRPNAQPMEIYISMLFK
jgi:hypothetical protein